MNNIMSAAAAVLCLSEVSFADAGNEGCTVNAGESARKLAAAAALLGKPDGQIAELLTERLLPLPGAERVTVSSPPAAQARDATAKALYARVFEVLVMELNAGLAASGGTDATSVGVLDIFGFENFASNSLEQLLINYANGACVGLWRVWRKAGAMPSLTTVCAPDSRIALCPRTLTRANQKNCRACAPACCSQPSKPSTLRRACHGRRSSSWTTRPPRSV